MYTVRCLQDDVSYIDDLHELSQQGVQEGRVSAAETGHFQPAQSSQQLLLERDGRPGLLPHLWQDALPEFGLRQESAETICTAQSAWISPRALFKS